MNVIFVYGTLQTGERNHNLLKNSKSLGEYDLDGYTLYELGSFPAIVKDKNGRVRGEAYLVDDETLRIINEFEGEGYIYI